MTAVNHRDLRVTFGHITVGPEDFPTVYVSRSEADLRRSLASVAYAYGWDVREEVVIPNWGRIDIVLEASGETYLVELKIDLTKPAQIRKGFQQADGYGRWWAANVGRPTDTILVGSKVDEKAISAAADAYLMSVRWKNVGGMLHFLERGPRGSDNSGRTAKASARAEYAIQIGEFHKHAASRLAGAAVPA